MTFRLAHFTDIHLTADPASLPWSCLLSKRITGWINLKLLGRYEKLADAERITEAFVRDIEEVAPDHILFTGDATGLSLDSEFARVGAVMAPLLERGNITGIPGNHDVYVRSAAKEKLYEKHLGRWEASDMAAPPLVVRFLGDHAVLICLKDSRPTSLLDSSGRCGADQLARLEEVLHRSDVASRVRIVALHYAPFRANGRPDSRRHGLRDGREFLDLVDRAKVDLVVHGHLHDRFVLPRATTRTVPIVNPGSMTFSVGEKAYHVYQISEGQIRLQARRFEESSCSFQPWPDAPGAGVVGR